MSLRLKIIVLFLAIVLVPLNLLGMITYSYFSKTLEDQTYHYTVQVIDQLNQNVNAFIDEMHRLSLLPLYDREILTILKNRTEHSYSYYPQTEELERMSSFLSTLSYNRQELSGVHIMTRDGSLFSDLGSPRTVHRFSDESSFWQQRIQQGEGASLLVPAHEPAYIVGNDKTVFSVGRLLRDPDGFRPLGMIKVDIEMSFIESLLTDVDLSEEASITMVDRDGQLIYETGKAITPLLKQADSEGQTLVERERVTADGVNYLPVLRQSSGEVQTIVLLPEDEIVGASQSLRMVTIGLMVVVSGVTLLLAQVAERSLTKPIFELRQMMQKAEKGEFQHRMKPSSKDELGQLALSYNHMMKQINELIAKVYQTEIREKDAEIKALQTQMNPHFIYNTLEHINMIAITKHEYELSDMVASLGRLIRYSIDQKTRFVPLRDELLFVKAYIAIQEKRLEGKVTFDIAIPEKMLTLFIPKLIIQPLLENAIVHGHQHGEIKGRIGVKGWQDHSFSYLEVRDQGQGMKQSMSIETGNRVALTNIADRLELLLGEQAMLTIKSEEGIGTSVTITLPKT
ncbi:cache domain-containing sensor histidine kinase [Shouchella lehensis]|uniref:Sensor histidine kinase n=1 Tax=Shouchella lehensis G1 TaxID=1246626 RepID=A0A060LZB3_9BACI|nr:sensor histidine kinase [Shouchella lehensis]AIC93154.1 sensor histidine kinase [Shouchella lehensis G1]